MKFKSANKLARPTEILNIICASSQKIKTFKNLIFRKSHKAVNSMNFNNFTLIKKAGFKGFKTMQELFDNPSELPAVKGVYLVLNLDKKSPSFLEIRQNWIENSIVVYIGKAGGEKSSATLKSRLRQYFGFGQGKNIGHWGGRLIWQLGSSGNLVVCWKLLPDKEPRKYEAQLINDFIIQFGNRPFANLVK